MYCGNVTIHTQRLERFRIWILVQNIVRYDKQSTQAKQQSGRHAPKVKSKVEIKNILRKIWKDRAGAEVKNWCDIGDVERPNALLGR